MENRPVLVSVILASYNHEHFVERAVKSVLGQSMSDLELIVIDDASSDRTAKIAENIRDSRLRLIRMPENRSVHTRNMGIDLARGKYIAFQNSDDEWDEKKLEKQVRILEERSDVVSCFTGVEIIDENGKPRSDTWAEGIFTLQNRSRIAWLRHFFEKGNCLCLTSSLSRKNDIDAVGRFRESLVQMGDFDLWTRLAARGNFHILDENLTSMRILKGAKNLSAPNPAVSNRGLIEYSRVLSRFAEGEIFENIDEIFGFALDPRAQTKTEKLAGLARYAWQFGVSHHLFADVMLERLIDDADTRAEIVALYGNQIILDFLKKRGRLEVSLKTIPA